MGWIGVDAITYSIAAERREAFKARKEGLKKEFKKKAKSEKARVKGYN